MMYWLKKNKAGAATLIDRHMVALTADLIGVCGGDNIPEVRVGLMRFSKGPLFDHCCF